jgi:Mor family transcriptional regulator
MTVSSKRAATLQKRDTAIFNFWLRGWTYQQIADRYDLSIARVNQIIASQKMAA